MDSKSVHHVHLIGVAGTGMGAFAGLLKEAAYDVSGSDMNTYPPMREKLQEWKIKVKTPYDARNLVPPPDLIIVGNVCTKDNVEAAYARENHLAYTSFPKALSDLFLKTAIPVVVCGTHGKTTSSSLLAFSLFHAKKDPSFLIGGIPLNFGESFRVSKSPKPYFVVEGDEYDTAYFDKGPKFLHYSPQYLLCTSLEYDHADIYANVEQIEERFSQLFALVPSNGVIVINSDELRLERALNQSHHKAPVVSYGANGDYQARNLVIDPTGISMDVSFRNTNQGHVHIALWGPHSVDNVLGCYAILHQIGLPHQVIADAFVAFAGVKRRMEELGTVEGCTVVDDFAHHPTAVKKTIEAARQRYPDRPLWALFEPRSATSCRRIFQNDYAVSFDFADRVMLAPSGRKLVTEEMLDLEQLASDVSMRGIKTDNYDSIPDMVKQAKLEAPPGTVFLCMSNGSFGGVHQQLLEAFSL